MVTTLKGAGNPSDNPNPNPSANPSSNPSSNPSANPSSNNLQFSSVFRGASIANGMIPIAAVSGLCQSSTRLLTLLST